MGMGLGRARISCAAITGKMGRGGWRFARNGMRYGHGLNARIAGCATAGQTRNRILKNILKNRVFRTEVLYLSSA